MTMPRMLKQAGYNIAYKGKWHLTKPVGGGEWHGKADAKLIAGDYDFDGWEPPDAGEDITPQRFGGGNAGFGSRRLGRGVHAPGRARFSRAHRSRSR